MIKSHIKSMVDFYISRNSDPIRKYIQLSTLIIGVGFFGFFAWASFVPLDKGVMVPGLVISDGQRKLIQNAYNGLVSEILVAEGDYVEQGQVLYRMNKIPAESEIGAIDSSLDGLEKAIASKKIQISLLADKVSNLKQLTQEGYYPLNQYNEQKIALEKIREQLISDSERINELSSKKRKLTYELENLDIKSPESGYVVNMNFFTVGGYLPVGYKLLEISPANKGIVVQGKLASNLIDKVRLGMDVEIRFPAFNYNTTPVFFGVLTVVGKDSLQGESEKEEPYYLIHAEVKNNNKLDKGVFVIQPGMPVEIFIVTGERSFLGYLVKPIIDKLYGSMRED